MEQRLCSPGSDFSKLSKHFICIRLYYTAKGASAPFAKLGLGNPVGPRNNVDLAFLTPDGRNIDVHSLQPMTGPGEGVWVRDLVAREKNQAGDGEEIVETTVQLMRKIAARYPVKKDVHAAPWQVSLSHAIFVSAWDSKQAKGGAARDLRRLVLASTAVEALDDPEVLRKFERHYVFARVEPKDAPAELKEDLERAGPQGLVLLDVAAGVDGFGEKQDKVARTYPKVLAVQAGPLTKATVVDLLGRHLAR
ncbi:MAG TPA: thioredoxin family protein [Planctomycetota bacterium]